VFYRFCLFSSEFFCCAYSYFTIFQCWGNVASWKIYWLRVKVAGTVVLIIPIVALLCKCEYKRCSFSQTILYDAETYIFISNLLELQAGISVGMWVVCMNCHYMHLLLFQLCHSVIIGITFTIGHHLEAIFASLQSSLVSPLLLAIMMSWCGGAVSLVFLNMNAC